MWSPPNTVAIAIMLALVKIRDLVMTFSRVISWEC